MDVVKQYSDQDTSWIEEASRGFLKLDEGVHEVMVLAPPALVKSKYGKDQLVFDCKVDGTIGQMAPPKSLARIIALTAKTTPFPFIVKVRREGTKIDTKITVVQ